MPNRFFTSDNHFFHKKILEMCPNTRQGSSIEELHELMIQKWNDTVKPYDTVEILGDFSFGKPQNTRLILERLNGVKNLVKGNHDHWLSPVTISYFANISDYKEYKLDKHNLVLFHYPIMQWNRCHYGAIHLHGHTHGSYHGEGKILDVGIDNRSNGDMGLWEWSEILRYMKDRPVVKHHINKDEAKPINAKNTCTITETGEVVYLNGFWKYCKQCKECFYYEGYNFEANLYDNGNTFGIKLPCQNDTTILIDIMPVAYDDTPRLWSGYGPVVFEEYIKAKGECHEN